MLNFFLKIKKFIKPELRVKLRKLYFNKFIYFIEDVMWKSEVHFEGFIISQSNEILNSEVKSLIRNNLYEKDEISAIEKLELYGENLIDLGSSIGLTSLKVALNTKNKKFVLVEPVLEYLEFSKNQLSRIDNGNLYFFENKAIDYSDQKKFINVEENNLLSKLNDSDGREVSKISIAKILEKYKINNFNLIIDIEGNSFDPLFNEGAALKNCKSILIEDNFNKYSRFQVEKRIDEIGFYIDFHISSGYGDVLAIKNKNLVE